MKKRILSMLLVATMVMSIFTGCGAGGSANEITVSEMLNSILEDEGEVVMYTFTKDGDDWTEDYAPSKKTNVQCYVYNGETETITLMTSSATGTSKNPLGDYLDGTCIADKEKSTTTSYNEPDDLTVVVDKEGNVLYETLLGVYAYSIRFGDFERKEINGVSCMVFATYYFGNEQNPKYAGVLEEVNYTIIADTDYTKDKTVVCDSADTEGILTETYDSSKLAWIHTSDKDWTPNN